MTWAGVTSAAGIATVGGATAGAIGAGDATLGATTAGAATTGAAVSGAGAMVISAGKDGIGDIAPVGGSVVTVAISSIDGGARFADSGIGTAAETSTSVVGPAKAGWLGPASTITIAVVASKRLNRDPLMFSKSPI